jgi:hypothetical protein
VQATTVVAAATLSQTPFALKVSKDGTQGFTRSGLLLVTNAANAGQVVRYTGLGADAFEGCTALLSGAGGVAVGSAVTQGSLAASIDRLLNATLLP